MDHPISITGTRAHGRGMDIGEYRESHAGSTTRRRSLTGYIRVRKALIEASIQELFRVQPL